MTDAQIVWEVLRTHDADLCGQWAALEALDRMVARIAALERQLREQCGEYYDPDFAARLRAESDAQESDDRARREQLEREVAALYKGNPIP